MVRVAAPAMSLEASGTLANALTFSRWKGRAYIRTRVIPKNPRSAAQVGLRSMVKFLSKEWADIAAGDQATWEDPAKADNVSPFNAYVRYNQANWRDNYAPAKAFPAARSTAATAITSIAAAAQERCIKLTITPAANTNRWGIAIYRKTATGVSQSWDLCVQVVPRDDDAEFIYIDGPLDPGTYYYKASAVNKDGVHGTISTEVNATVT